MSLKDYLDKLVEEHEETKTLFTYTEFKNSLLKNCKILKDASDDLLIQVLSDAYEYYKYMMED